MKNLIFTIALIFGGNSANAYAVSEEAPLAVLKISDGRSILTKDGLSVYIFDEDSGGISSCYDACASAWPAVLVTAETVLGSSMGVTVRNDGAQQLTYKGQPVYFFVGDGASEDINGDGLGGVWHIIVL